MDQRVGRSDVSDRAPRRTRVLHLVSTFAAKTDTKWLVQIARHLDRARFELSAACCYGGGPVECELRSLGVTTHNLDTPGEWDVRAIGRASALFARVRPDIVHTHLLRADLFGGLAARWAGVPVIVSTAYAVGDYRRAVRRRSDGVLDAVCGLLPTHVLAVSDAVRRDCVERLGLAPSRVRVIHTGIDPPDSVDANAVRRVRAELGARPGDRLILAVARLSYEKGIEVLIDAAAIVRTRHATARFAVLGDGPLRGALQTRINRLGLGECVRLAGFCEDVWPALAAADVVCMPSLMEGMPNALLEAMALARPVVASDVGGIPEAIVDGVSGLLSPPGDAGELAGRLCRALADPDWASALGRAARVELERRFLARDVVARYAQWYESLVRQSREGAA